MTAAGLLARRRAAGDGRTNVVRLTEQGTALLEESTPKVARADKRLLKLLPGKKREDFVALMQALIKQAATDAGAPEEGAEKLARPRREKKVEPAPPVQEA